MSAVLAHHIVPNANSPQLLARLVDAVARGVRSSRGLAETLGVELRTVQYYLQAGTWLGLLRADGEARLTSLGLEFAYAAKQRSKVYARAVWSTPFVIELMMGREGKLPSVEDVTQAILTTDSSLATSTARRRASAVRSLISPALRSRPPRPQRRDQLELPLTLSAPIPQVPRLKPQAAKEYDPDVYRYLLSALLDYGELGLGQLRSLLDRARISGAPIGSYVHFALTRGDATRCGDVLVVSSGAVRRREVVASTASVMLSDSGYRQWLQDLRLAERGEREAEIRRQEASARYRFWDRRLFGRAVAAQDLDAELQRVLMDRSLQSFPLAGTGGDPILRVEEPFLDVWEQRGLPIARPPTLIQLQGGLQAVNRMFQGARFASNEVHLPDLAFRPTTVHGPLLHPGEPLPRSIPDAITLRLRLLMNAPYAALCAALLLLHRDRPAEVSLNRKRGSWWVHSPTRRLGTLFQVLDGFATSRGWLPIRRASSPLTALGFLRSLDRAGILTLLEHQAILSESLFSRLRTEAEEMEVYARLLPLSEALSAYLDVLEATPVIEDGPADA